MILIRSLIFWAGWALVTIVYAVIALLVMPMSPVPRYRVMSTWSVLVTRWLELSCGLRYQVEGLENLPKTPAMIMPKHQSAWETMALQCFIPPLAWVLKRELLLIPFFGWAARATSRVSAKQWNTPPALPAPPCSPSSRRMARVSSDAERV